MAQYRATIGQRIPCLRINCVETIDNFYFYIHLDGVKSA